MFSEAREGGEWQGAEGLSGENQTRVREGGEEKVVQKVIEGWRRGNLVKKRV